MARPRIFVSSTYYDLRVIRADLERFIKEFGYEPVLFERGHVPYGKEEALEEYCYREIANCDIVITLIGGKIGTQSKDQQNSITQNELRKAIESGKQVYIFIEKAVLSEYRTFLNNRDVKGFKPAAVNDIKIYKFIEDIYSLQSGNPIEGFEISDDIFKYLREQWAGLFQRLLHESSRKRELDIIDGLKSTAATLNNLVTFLTEERSAGDAVIKDILLSSHPAFQAIKQHAKIPYRVIFSTFEELDLLLTARQFELDDISSIDEDFIDWDNRKQNLCIRIHRDIFDHDNKLKVFTPNEWNEKWITSFQLSKPSKDEDDDDIPF